ncbi:MAG: hypothetical protein PGN09_06600 [Sphingomonas fennica]
MRRKGGGTIGLAMLGAMPAAAQLPAIAAPVAGRLAAVADPILLRPSLRRGTLIARGLPIVTRSKGPVSGVTLTDIDMVGSTFLFRAFGAADAVTDLTVRRVRSTEAGPGFLLLRGRSADILIEDVTVAATTPETRPGKVPEGIALAGKTGEDVGRNVTIRRVSIDGIRSTEGFQNGDGFSVERGWQDVSISDSYAGHNSDAGFDIKSPTARLDRVTAEGNRRNYKFWSDQTHGLLTSIDAGGPGRGAAAHIQLLGSPEAPRTLKIERLVVRSTTPAPIFLAGQGAWDVTIGSCDIRVPPGTPVTSGAVTLHGGPGCPR